VINYSTRNWIALVFSLQGTIVKRVALRTLFCGALAAVAVYLKQVKDIDLSTPVIVHSIIGVALGLLLVFRTNSSYDRYWEGRKTVGDMVSHCRDLARQTTAYLAKDEERLKLAGRYIIAYYTAVRRQLRQEHHHPELVALLGEERVKELDLSEEPPLTVATWLTELYVSAADEGIVTEQRLRTLDTNLTALIEHWSDAERIHKTPVPFAYAHHIKVFLSLFCFTVPFALAHVATYYAIGGSAVVAFALFGIDEIGVEIEDPFGYDENDLPLDEIGSQLEVDVSSITTPPESG
jgi:putative membrane protein